MSVEPTENSNTADVVVKNDPVNGANNGPSVQAENITLNYTEEMNKIKDVASTYLFQQTQPVILPTYSKWFDLDTIHDIEKEFFKEFFNEGDYTYKNHRTYKDCRDFIVNTYRLHPLEYLTITAVRRNLNLDIQSIIKVHQFLEKWGIINYQIDPRTRPSIVAPGYTGHFNVVLDTPRGLKMFVPGDFKVVETGADGKTEEKKSYELSLHENKYSKGDDYLVNALNKKDPISKIKYICQTCGVDCTSVVYHNLRDKSNNVCVACFKEAKFLTIYSSSDFLRLNINEEDIDADDWSSSDLFKLLEAIEMFENDWTKVAKYTNKTKEQCVMKFLSLPIEDEHFNKVVLAKENEGSAGKHDFEEFMQRALSSLNDESKSKLIENSNLLSQKYINETNVIIQRLTKNKLESINLKLEKIDYLEQKYTGIISEYENRLKKLALAEANFEKKLTQLNDKLAASGITDLLNFAEDAVVEELVSVEKTDVVDEKPDAEMESKEPAAEEAENDHAVPEKPLEYKIWAL